MGSDKEIKAIAEVIAKFPATFRLANHSGTFRIGARQSYFRGPGECGGELMLYTQRLLTREEYAKTYANPPRSEDDLWVDFVKGTEDELRRNISPA